MKRLTLLTHSTPTHFSSVEKSVENPPVVGERTPVPKLDYYYTTVLNVLLDYCYTTAMLLYVY